MGGRQSEIPPGRRKTVGFRVVRIPSSPAKPVGDFRIIYLQVKIGSIPLWVRGLEPIFLYEKGPRGAVRNSHEPFSRACLAFGLHCGAFAFSGLDGAD